MLTILIMIPEWFTGALPGNSLVVRRVSPGRIMVVLFWTKYAVPRQIKPGILKLTTSRDQRNLCTVFIFVSYEEKGCYRIVSLGHQNYNCRSYCGLSRRMQGCYSRECLKKIQIFRVLHQIDFIWFLICCFGRPMLTIFEELVSVAICSRSNLRSTGLLSVSA